MRIPPLTALRVEDFPSEQRAWLPRMFLPLNSFLTAASSAINGRIEFGSNIPSADLTLSFVYSGVPQRFAWTQVSRPAVALVGSCFEDNQLIGLTPVWAFDSSTQTISMDFYKLDGSALVRGSSYSVFVRIVP